jgi:hypothetical protein
MSETKPAFARPVARLMHYTQVRGFQRQLRAHQHGHDVVDLWCAACTWSTIAPLATQSATQTVTITDHLSYLLPLWRRVESASR